ncbi:PqqD family protein [Robertmurraya beringensis]|uniref:PqqD family protein n=1 Tax=Robertmurraya beringensis TaxID=641660 RepID=A0ABV6KRR1_9BACI
MTHYIQKESLDTSQLDGDWIILDAEHFTVTKLNEMGGFCWSLLKEKQTAGSIIQSIEAEFQGNLSIDAKDIEEFLKELVEYGLVIHAV